MRLHRLLATTALGLGLAFSASGSAGAADAAAALKAVGDHVMSLGPNGEKPELASSVSLTDGELATIKGKHAKAAIVMHYAGNDWSQAQIQGLKAEFGKMGIDVIAVTDAGFKPDKQVSDIETVLAQKPDIIVSIPSDPIATANEYKAAAAAGVKLVFMDNVPKGMTAGKDYVSVVSADNYGNGVASALLLGQAMGGKGDVGLVYHAADFFVTKQRYDAVKKTLAEYFPDIHVVAEQGIGGPRLRGRRREGRGRHAGEPPLHQGHLGGVGRAGRGRGRGGLDQRPRRPDRHQLRPRRERRHQHGVGRGDQGPVGPAPLRSGCHGSDAGRLRAAGQGRRPPMWRCRLCR